MDTPGGTTQLLGSSGTLTIVILLCTHLCSVIYISRNTAQHHLLRPKSYQTSHNKNWLCRLTGLGTGLSLCAKPVLVPADDKKAKLLVSRIASAFLFGKLSIV